MREIKRQTWANLKKETESIPGRRLLIGEDFNCKIEKIGERKTSLKDEEDRISKDSVCNEEGRVMLRWMEETGTHVLNGNI